MIVVAPSTSLAMGLNRANSTMPRSVIVARILPGFTIVVGGLSSGFLATALVAALSGPSCLASNGRLVIAMPATIAAIASFHWRGVAIMVATSMAGRIACVARPVYFDSGLGAWVTSPSAAN